MNMLNVQSPLVKKYRNRESHDLVSPPIDTCHNDDAPGTHHCLQGLNRTVYQLQRMPSLKELDCLHRLRREELERRNAELQSISVMNKLMIQAGKLEPFSSMKGMKPTFAQKSIPSMNTEDFDSDLLELMDDLGSDDESATLDCRTANNVKPRAPAPRLDIRPQRNFLAFKEEPVVILPAPNEDKFGDLFPSPHSNKFVLQFPNAPTQELTLSDSLEIIEGGNIMEDSTCTNNVKSSGESDVRDSNGNVGARTFRPLESNTWMPLSDDVDSPGRSSGTSSSTGCSPTATQLYYNMKTKVSLKPKKRRSHSTIEINGDHSPRSSSCSSFEEENNNTCYSTCTTGPIPVLPRSKSDVNGIDQITRDLRLYDISLDRMDQNASLSNSALDKSSAFLSLRPKRSRRPSIVLRAPYQDDRGDELMELDPNFSLSKDGEKSTENGMIMNCNHGYDQGLTLHHHRCPSVSFSDENDYSYRSRTFSASSIQGIIEITKESSSKFLGITRQTSLGSFNTNNMMSPSDLSESKFRTPNPESALESYSFSLGNVQSHLNDILDEDKKKDSDLLLPKLFSSASEDEFELIL
mmetsp:Transcript_4102/g.7869  ORF Transcript_4102/g.7869 Transcript_4102/m.7869 type:complete len:579 (-) Transcript_4102:229-1965(-)